MKKKNPVIKMFIFMLVTGAIITSCLAENMDDCPPADNRHTVHLLVKTLNEVENTGGGYDIDNVRIYVFDEFYLLTSIWNGGAYIPGMTYVAEIKLTPGTYHFVAWTNQGNIYDHTLTGEDNAWLARELVTAMQYPEGGKITGDIPDLHHGMLDHAGVTTNADNEFTIIIKPNIYKLNFTVEGLPETVNDYSFTVRDNNSQYTFDNSFVEDCEDFEYIRIANFSEQKLYTSMKVLRLAAERSPHFTFSDASVSRTLYESNLIHMIKAAYTASGQILDFDRIFEFDIKLIFDVRLNVTISVNGWTYTPNETEL